jgi:ABC-2 type transport system permease protein
MNGTVAAPTAVRLSHGVLLRQLLTRGRVVGLTLLGVAVAVIGFAVGRADHDDPLEVGVRIIADVGFTIVVPIVALVFAAGALGDAREDGTLVYLWLRPMPRWTVVTGAFLAAVTLIVPITVVPVTAAAALLDVGADLVTGTLIAAVVGSLAYAALFVLLGLLVKNPIVWGLFYVLLWEGVAAAFGSLPAKLAVRGYTRSILTARTGVDLDLGDLSLVAGIAVPLLIVVAALGLAAIRLDRLEVD